MNTYVFLFGSTTNTQHTALIVSTVRARNKFSISSVSWEPCLEIVFFGSCVIESSRNNSNDLIGKSERLHEFFWDLDHVFMSLPRIFRFCDDKLFNFLELMHSENTPGIFSVGTCLFSEARTSSCVLDGQLSLLKPLSSMQSRDGLFWGSNQIERVIGFTLKFIELFVEVAELTSLGHNLFFKEERRLYRFVASFGQKRYSIAY